MYESPKRRKLTRVERETYFEAVKVQVPSLGWR